MQTSDRVLARRYAKAFFETVKAADAPRLRKDLAVAIKLLRDHQGALRHPLTPASGKSRLLREQLGDQVGEESRRFIEYLIKRKRYMLLPFVAAEMERIIDEETKTARAHVRVARPLDEAGKSELQKRLSKYLGKEVILDVKEDPALIGGIVVKVGDKVLDASVTRQLERLREKFLAA